MTENSDQQLTLLLRYSRRLALERDPDTLRRAAVQFVLEVVAGDAAALVRRDDDGEIEVMAHFGVSLDAQWPTIRRCVSEAISGRRATLVHTDPSRAEARPDKGRVAAAPCPIDGHRGALVLTRLETASELRLEDMPLLRMAAIQAAEALRRVRAEAKAAALELHVDTLGATTDGAFLLVDDALRVVRANAAASAALGARTGSLQGQRLADIAGAGPLVRAASGPAKERHAVSLPGGRFSCRCRRHAHGAVVVLEPAERSSAPKTAHRARYRFDDLLTQDSQVLRALDAARQTAQSGVSILITGESGTGKEVLAQAIHAASPQADEPFVAVNVAAIPSDLLESELFGYEAGAFTGAGTQGKPGSFEVAGRGTLLLDEIGEMSSLLQTKLLRVLQERQLQRLGGTVPIPIHARVLATTNRDLQQEVASGRFRLDLYHRLKVVSIGLPPLRKRRGDIPLLAEHYLTKACEQLGRSPLELSPAVLDQLVHHDWPGNIRELSNLLLGVVSLLPDEARVVEDLPVFLSRPELTPLAPARVTAEGPTPRRMGPPSAPDAINSGMISMELIEKAAIQATLEAQEGNVSEAARVLGISRTTLYTKVKKYGLE